MKIIKNTIIVVLMLALLVFIISRICIIVSEANKEEEEIVTNFDTPSTRTNDSTRNKNTNRYGLAVENVKGEADEYWYYVKGFIVNNSANDYEEVLVQYDALDSDGYKLITCSDIAYNLGSGEKYAFKATCVTDQSKIATYKLYQLVPLQSSN